MTQTQWQLKFFTRRRFPDDLPSLSDSGFNVSEEYDGALYQTSRAHPLHTIPATEVSAIKLDAAYLKDQIGEFNPRIVHGASNWRTGLSAIMSARQLGLPTIYEVRGLWHLTRISKDPAYEGTPHFAHQEAMELMTCRLADRVITITSALKQYLMEHGIDGEKIDILPNAVDAGKFELREPDLELKRSLGLEGKTIIGFVGSIIEYEGVHLAIEAISRLTPEVKDAVGVLIVGGGAFLPKLRKLAKEYGVSEQVVFAGRVPFDEVGRFYSVIDIAPFPRLPLAVCELVSPLKPFEAMAMGKAVIASNVASHLEFIDEDKNAVSFQKGDVEDFAAKLNKLVSHEDRRRELGAAAREWVLHNRTWEQNAKTLSGIYEDMTGGGGS